MDDVELRNLLATYIGCSQTKKNEWKFLTSLDLISLYDYFMGKAIGVNLLHTNFGGILKWYQHYLLRTFARKQVQARNQWPYHKRRFDQNTFNYKLRAVIKWVYVVHYHSRSDHHKVELQIGYRWVLNFSILFLLKYCKDCMLLWRLGLVLSLCSMLIQSQQ